MLPYLKMESNFCKRPVVVCNSAYFFSRRFQCPYKPFKTVFFMGEDENWNDQKHLTLFQQWYTW